MGSFSDVVSGLSCSAAGPWGESVAGAQVVLLMVSGSADGGPARVDHRFAALPSSWSRPSDSSSEPWRAEPTL